MNATPVTPHWTPLHLKLVIHFNGSDTPFHPLSPVVEEYTQDLMTHGLVQHTAYGHGTTARGQAFIELLCRTPLPEQRWCTPDGTIIPTRS